LGASKPNEIGNTFSNAMLGMRVYMTLLMLMELQK
jgi:hypothetical protein